MCVNLLSTDILLLVDWFGCLLFCCCCFRFFGVFFVCLFLVDFVGFFNLFYFLSFVLFLFSVTVAYL